MLPYTQTPSLQLMYAIKPSLLKILTHLEKLLCFEDKKVKVNRCVLGYGNLIVCDIFKKKMRTCTTARKHVHTHRELLHNKLIVAQQNLNSQTRHTQPMRAN